MLNLLSRFASRDASCFGASDSLCRQINSGLIAISSSAVITCHRVLLLLYDFVVSGKVLRLCTRQCSIACSEAEASSSSLLVIIYFQHLVSDVSFFFSFVLQVSLSLGVVPSRVEFFPPASILMSPSCLLTQHATGVRLLLLVACASACSCVCLAGVWGSGARGPVACSEAGPRRGALRTPSGHWPRLRIAVVMFSRPPPAGNAPRPLPCCSARAAPVQYSARAGLQVTRICPQMPAAGVLKAHCQGGLLAPPPPSCWVLHVRGL